MREVIIRGEREGISRMIGLELHRVIDQVKERDEHSTVKWIRRVDIYCIYGSSRTRTDEITLPKHLSKSVQLFFLWNDANLATTVANAIKICFEWRLLEAFYAV